MIISHEHKFIFLKTRKVAGSSIELYLRRFCGPDDIITPLDPKEEEIARSIGARPPSAIHERPAFPWELTWRKIQRIGRKRRWPVTREWWTHQPASEIRRRVGTRVWDDYFKFSITRNPWDQVVSVHFYRNALSPLHSSVDRAIPKQVTNWDVYTIGNKVAVDHMIRFESLLEDFGDVCDRIGLPRPTELPRLKSGLRPSNATPSQILSQRDIDRISKICRREIEFFGYEFGLDGPL